MGKSKKFKTVRNWNAVDAHFRNSAGAMKDRRDGRSGATNISRDLIGDYLLEVRGQRIWNIWEKIALMIMTIVTLMIMGNLVYNVFN